MKRKLNSQSNFEKGKQAGGLTLPDFHTYYRAIPKKKKKEDMCACKLTLKSGHV